VEALALVLEGARAWVGVLAHLELVLVWEQELVLQGNLRSSCMSWSSQCCRVHHFHQLGNFRRMMHHPMHSNSMTVPQLQAQRDLQKAEHDS